jgi:citrate lyase beta subunit
MADAQKLGASLYVPATHRDLLAVANGQKYPKLRSVILCTEDSVGEADVQDALRNLYRTLDEMGESASLRFVRPRNVETLQRILEMPGVEKLDGFVLPKFTRRNMHSYLRPLANTHFMIMPTLETGDVFEEHQMRRLRDALVDSDWVKRVLALRIGGNDLLALLGIRRPRGMTLYETPVGDVISSLVRIFRPSGMHLTAPVFEYLDDAHMLQEEIRRDMAYGLIGKTAIHPDQIELIESFYQVPPDEFEAAQRMLSKDCPGVFKLHGAMCEPATHLPWARAIVQRAATYGLREATCASGS